MRLFELFDASDKQMGDESNPQSPYYNGPEEFPVKSIEDTFKKWIVYDSNGEVVDEAVEIDFKLSYEYEPAFNDEGDEDGEKDQEITDFEILQIRVKGKKYTFDEACAVFGAEEFDLDVIKENISEEFI